MSKKYISLFFVLNFLVQSSKSQNARFTQIFNAPVMLNPALAGKFNGAARVGLLYSWQNSTIANVAHQNIYADVKLFSKKNKNDKDSSGYNLLKQKSYFGIALNHYQYGNDLSGFSQNTTPIEAKFTSLTGSYHFNLTKDAKYYMGVGFQLTNAEATLDETRGTDYNLEVSGGGFRYRKTPSGNLKNSKGYFDYSIGTYLGFQTEEHLLEMGFAAYHLPQPYNDLNNDPDSKLRRRFSAYTNAFFKVSDAKQILFRNVYWEEGIYQASTNYKDSAYITAFYSGVEFINTKPKNNTHVDFGLMTRNFQSAIINANVFFGSKFNTRVSYEVPLSKTIHPANNAYRFELFFGYHLRNNLYNTLIKNRRNLMF
jgi:hypothetical protein